MHDQFYIELVQKDLLGVLAPAEIEELERWKVSNPTLASTLYNALSLSKDYGGNIKVEVAHEFENLLDKRKKITTKSEFHIFNYKSMLGVAAGVLALVAVIYFFNANSELDSGMITIVASQDLHEVELPDGTQVLLAGDSKITYSSDFGLTRTIQLEGSAFLDVASDPSSPFEVKSPHLLTRVLGTQFIISDNTTIEAPRVQLLEGKVELIDRSNKSQLILEPRESGSIVNGVLTRFDLRYDGSAEWLFGSLDFDDVSFPRVIEHLERRYHIRIDYPQVLSSCRFVGDLSNLNVNQAVEAISIVYGTDLEIQGDIYKLKGSASCN